MKWILLLALLPDAALAADVTMHWCEKPNGTGGNYPVCPEGYAQKDSPAYVPPPPAPHVTDISEYNQYCFASGYSGMDCQNRQARAKDYMTDLSDSPSVSKEQKDIIDLCWHKWFKPTMKVVDAVMWQYCYAHY